jgi:hypothetical protein
MTFVAIGAGAIGYIFSVISSYCNQRGAIYVWETLLKQSLGLSGILGTYKCLYHVGSFLRRKLSAHHLAVPCNSYKHTY